MARAIRAACRAAASAGKSSSSVESDSDPGPVPDPAAVAERDAVRVEGALRWERCRAMGLS